MPKILLFDIETAPVLAYVWKLFDENIGLNQIHSDWFILSWAAKWMDESTVMYQDQRHEKDIEDDSELLKGIWNLLDEADIIITQNGKRFDIKKLNARFLINGMKPPSPCHHIDTFEIAKRRFGFTSNKLEYMSNTLNVKYKKLRHNKFDGFELWKECLRGNQDAWKEMEKYNKYDVLALEELYLKLAPWDNTSIMFSVFDGSGDRQCNCGGRFESKGYRFTTAGKYRRYVCRKCGTHVRGATNEMDKEQRLNIYRKIP